jgi:biotin carboxyl carrier protein
MDALATKKVNELKAPMPGLVLDVRVKVGDVIKKGEPLVVLEAMKMENVLKSIADVTIKKIAIEKGNAVEKNQVLIFFE